MATRDIVLDILYSPWKDIVQGATLSTTYKETQRPDSIVVWAGNASQIFRAHIGPDDHPDWVTTFSGTAILVSSEDEAITKIAEIASGGAINANSDITNLINIEPSISDGKTTLGGGLSIDVSSARFAVNNKYLQTAGGVALPVTDNATSYVYLDNTGLQVTTSGFPSAAHVRLSRVTATSGIVCHINDDRVLLSGADDAWTLDEFVPTLGQVTFILSNSPTDLNALQFSINSIAVASGTEYSISGKTVTWLNTTFSLETTDFVTARYK